MIEETEHSFKRVVFLSSPNVWARGHGPDHPLKPERLQRTHELLDEYGAFTHMSLVDPRPATEEELALFHTREYINAVRGLSTGDSTILPARYRFGSGDNPVFPGMFESERVKVGSALQAAELLVRGECDVAFSYSGGLHHGGADFASGFCVFNDAAVAIHWLLKQDLRVAYVDIDVHHGDGVQDAFYNSDQVLTISLHQDGRTLFPGTGFVDEDGDEMGKGYSVNVPLPPYTDDEVYVWAFNQVVPPLLNRFEPDILVTQLGVDTHYKDPLAQLTLTTRGHTALYQSLAALNLPWLALGGGGYDISVVPRSWTLAVETMIGGRFPDKLPSSYRSRYGGEWLRDEEQLHFPPGSRERIRGMVEAIVDQVEKKHQI